MTYEPIIVKLNEKGKIELTEEELKEMLKSAYNNGYSAGSNSYIKYVPYGTNPIVWGSGTGTIISDNTNIPCTPNSNVNGSEVLNGR